MTVKKQWKKIKDNWLLIGVGLILVFFLMGGGTNSIRNIADGAMYMGESAMGYAPSAMKSMDSSGGRYYENSNFAPDVEDRKITKSASLTCEVKRGQYDKAEGTLKNIVRASDAYILSQNSNTYDQGWRSYKQGYYTIKVDSDKYDSIVSQLKAIGVVQSYNENAQDITGSYTNTEIEIDVEKSRLKRYQEIYDETKESEFKIQLINNIFDQERKIKYLEDSLTNMDLRVDYSTISVSLREKQSDWTNIAFVKLSSLVRSFVSSVNSVLQLFFVIIPWALTVGIVWWIVRKFRKKKK